MSPRTGGQSCHKQGLQLGPLLPPAALDPARPEMHREAAAPRAASGWIAKGDLAATQNQPGRNLRIINGLQTNQQFLHHLCSGQEDASTRKAEVKHQQRHTTRQPESLCSGGRSSSKPPQLLPKKIRKPTTCYSPAALRKVGQVQAGAQNWQILYNPPQVQHVEVPYATQF